MIYCLVSHHILNFRESFEVKIKNVKFISTDLFVDQNQLFFNFIFIPFEHTHGLKKGKQCLVTNRNNVKPKLSIYQTISFYLL